MVLKSLATGLGIGLVVGLGTMAVAGGNGEPGSPPPAPTPEGPRTVAVAAVTTPDGAGELRFSGIVRAERRADVAFTVPGRIGQRRVDVGDRVKAGQAVARLDAGQYQNNLRRARATRADVRARLDKSRRDLARVEALLAERAAGLEEVEAVRTGVEAAEAGLAAAEAQVAEALRQQREAILVAPFSGVVTQVFAEPGEYARPGVPILAISATSALEVEVDVPESLRARVGPGDSVTIDLPLLGRAGLEATVASVGAAARNGRLFPVIVTLPDEVQNVSPGVTADVVIAGDGQPSGLVVPIEALVNPTGGTSYVYRVVANRVERVTVGVVGLEGALVRVEGALTADDTIVTHGQENLVAGEIVVVQQ